MSGPVNQHGRKWGRGLRPWLLIPKVLCVAAGFGGTLAAGVCLATIKPGHSQGQIVLIATIARRIIDGLVIPSLVLTVMLSVGLLAMHGLYMVRMRWLGVKLLLVIGLMPWPLLGARSQMRWLVRADPMVHSAYPAGGVTLGLLNVAGALLLWIAIIWLGRHKPRLGQNIATVYQQRKLKEQFSQ